MAIKSADQISIVDITDAYSVILTNDSYTFPGTVNAAKPGSCTTQIIAMRGSEQIAATVNLNNVVTPTGITVTKDNDATSPTLTITASASFTAAGVVRIPVVVDSDITINKEMSLAIAFTGATGQPGAAGAEGSAIWTATAAPTTPNYTWNESALTGPEGMTVKPGDIILHSYYRYTVLTVDSGSVFAGSQISIRGGAGASGTASLWYSGTAITGTSTTATVFSGSGISKAVVGDMYLNTETYNTYRCTTAGSASAAKWVYVNNIKGEIGATGPQGDPGADAITMSITSSNGMIFKNSAIETTLTAHVFKAGVEVTGNDLAALGTVKWYKDGNATPIATGQTLNVSAGDVTNKATYIAQLEG